MRQINQCLNKQLVDICQKSMQLDELNELINHYLIPPLRGNCHVGSFNKGRLIFVISNPALATELRYLLPSLRDQLRQAGLYQLISTEIYIDKDFQNKEPLLAKPQNKLFLSAQASQTIQTISDNCSYRPLKEALSRLAKHTLKK